MELHFSKEELESINALVQTSYCSTLAGKELTYGENLENLLLDKKAKEQIASEVIIDYIEQLELEKQFYMTLGFDDMPVINKIVLVLKDILKARKL